MNEAPHDDSVADAERELARLNGQVAAMRAVLVRLLQDVVRAEHRLDRSQSAQIVEANERLILAALSSQDLADASAASLKDAQRLSEFDALTQLPNRSTLLDRSAQAIANAKRHGARLALLFIDLDNFKQINDTHGHAFGDEALRQVAERLVSSVREVDTVSRHGGDEFLVLLAEVSQAHDAAQIAAKLLAAVGAPAEVDGQRVDMNASVGIAIYPEDGEDIDTLMAHADAAMYHAKRQGGGYAFHGKTPADMAKLPVADLAVQQATLREANEKLVLAALSAQELQQAAVQAQQRQAAFMAAVAEELRNPLAPIRIATAMLGRLQPDEPLMPRLQGIVERQMAHLARLVGHLVDASGVHSGALQLERRVVDMASVIDEAVAAERPMMAARRQQFELQRPDGALEVIGDRARLVQVVSNLLDNASSHGHEGGRIGLRVALDGQALKITVADDGIGITPQMLAQIFEPFVQDNHAVGYNGVGLGIGLTVARALLQAHGGSLVAHSPGAGAGSQFVITLPTAAGGTPAA